ncbi:MAG: hypothetical protein H7146_06435 [Burkholderiaceae bacterium]|nr:hypothetical protein [Microbacteriaceae bacterium]
MSPSTGRHRAVTRPRRLRIPRVAALLRSSAALVLSVGLATVAAGGSYAFWNSSEATGSASLQAGTAAITVAAPAAMSSHVLYPGATVFLPVAVRNTGDVALKLRVAGIVAPAAATTTSAVLVVGASIAPSAAACTAGTVTRAWTGTFSDAPAGSLNSTLAIGSTAVLCLSVALPLTAPTGGQNLTIPGFGVLIDGMQA